MSSSLHVQELSHQKETNQESAPTTPPQDITSQTQQPVLASIQVPQVPLYHRQYGDQPPQSPPVYGTDQSEARVQYHGMKLPFYHERNASEQLPQSPLPEGDRKSEPQIDTGSLLPLIFMMNNLI